MSSLGFWRNRPGRRSYELACCGAGQGSGDRVHGENAERPGERVLRCVALLLGEL